MERKPHAKPRPRSVSWWLLALKEQSPGGSVRDLSLSRDGPNRHIGVLRAELSHLPPRSIVQTRTPNVLPSIRALAIPAFTRSDSRMPSWFASAASSPISASLKIPVESR